MSTFSFLNRLFLPMEPQPDPGSDTQTSKDGGNAVKPAVTFGGSGWVKGLHNDGTRQGVYEALERARMQHTHFQTAINLYGSLAATGDSIQPQRDIDKDGNPIKRQNVVSISMDDGSLEKEIAQINELLGMQSRAKSTIEGMVFLGDVADELVYGETQGLYRLSRFENIGNFVRLENEQGMLQLPYSHYYEENVNRRKGRYFHPYQVAHYAAGSPDRGYGFENGLFYHVMLTARELALMHNSTIYSRLTDPDGRLVMYVDTGNMEGDERDAYIQAMKRGFNQTRRLTPQGDIILDRNPLRQGEPIFVGVNKELALTKFAKLPSTGGLGSIRDVVYHLERLLAGIGVHKSVYGMPVPYAARGAMAEQMKLTQKNVQSYRQDYERPAAMIYVRALMVNYGITEDYLKKRSIVFDWPELTHTDTLKRIAIKQAQYTLAAQAQELLGLPAEELMLRFLDFSPQDIERLSPKMIDPLTMLDDPAAFGFDPEDPDPLGTGKEARKRVTRLNAEDRKLLKTLKEVVEGNEDLRAGMEHLQHTVQMSLDGGQGRVDLNDLGGFGPDYPKEDPSKKT